MPIVYRCQWTGKWDCLHWCNDCLSGTLNQPTRDAAIQVWNKLARWDDNEEVQVIREGLLGLAYHPQEKSSKTPN